MTKSIAEKKLLRQKRREIAPAPEPQEVAPIKPAPSPPSGRVEISDNGSGFTLHFGAHSTFLEDGPGTLTVLRMILRAHRYAAVSGEIPRFGSVAYPTQAQVEDWLKNRQFIRNATSAAVSASVEKEAADFSLGF